MLNNESVKNKIFFVYFTCDKHFQYLLISLKSLKKVSSVITGNVYLYIDKDDFLSDVHLDRLKEIKLEFKIRKCEKITWGGEQLVMNELSAFKEICKELNAEDYMAKVDSDVLFISDSIFHDVLKSNSDLVGKEETLWWPFTYVQGGCYFLKASFIPELLNFKENIFFETLSKINNKTVKSKNRVLEVVPEDAVIFSIAKSKTDKISFRDYYGAPNLRNGNNVSLIHFQHCKELMKIHSQYGHRGVLFKLALSNLRERCLSLIRSIFKKLG